MKTLYFFTLSLILLSACKNDDTDIASDYYMRFYADSTRIEFTAQDSLVAYFTKFGDLYFIDFWANASAVNSSYLKLRVEDDKTVSATTYLGNLLVFQAFVKAVIRYRPKNGVEYSSGGVDVSGYINSNAIINIIEITSSSVRGTFSGTVQSPEKPGISISRGEFFLRREDY